MTPDAAHWELEAMTPRVDTAIAALLGASSSPPASTGTDWTTSDASGLLAAYGDGHTDPAEVVDAHLERIARLDGAIGSLWAIDDSGARAAAEHSAARWRAGTARPLEGVPIVVKDLLDTADLVTTGGSRWFEGFRPTADAGVVAAVRAAGAIVLAKSATFELGCGDEQTPFGVVHNPWDLSRTTGGSSAGSAAALAARFAPLALGTDTGGSIRIPSAYCGVVGLKPTLARLATTGLVGLAPTLDCPGPMARTARDVRRLLDVMTPTVDGPPVSLAGARIGVARRWFCDVLADDVAAAFDTALIVLREAGAVVVEVDVPMAEHGANLSWLITMFEAAATYPDAPHDQLTPAFRNRLIVGSRVSASQYTQALRARSALTRRVLDAFAGIDALVVPATIQTAPPLDDLDRPVAGVPANWADTQARTIALWNVTGLPAVSVPIGFGAEGLPVGMQVVGPSFADELVLGFAAAFQDATDHHLREPV